MSLNKVCWSFVGGGGDALLTCLSLDSEWDVLGDGDTVAILGLRAVSTYVYNFINPIDLFQRAVVLQRHPEPVWKTSRQYCYLQEPD